MDEQKKRQVVVVTGASAGIGRATVRAFAQRGADVALIARGQQGLDAAKREVEAAGGRALSLPVDVADAEAMLRAAERTEQELGHIDVWVNNAMVSVFAPFWEIEPAEYQRVTDVTYHGYVNGTRAALRHMRPRKRGTIVMVGSALAYRSIPLQSAYCGAKSAILGFTDSLRAELAHEQSRIRLTAVHLPAHNTPQFGLVRSRLPREAQPVPPIFQPELAAEAIVWAAEHDRREIHLATPTVAAIMAQKFVPEWMDRYTVGAWEAQMTDEPRDSERPDNLFTPVEGDHGAHGEFDAQARESSPLWWLDRNRTWVVGATAGVAAAVGVVAGALRRGGLNGGDRR
jgi:NAD(P)-dependent dehydrogenase (short-subunit alcohol dehydrogenase family)